MGERKKHFQKAIWVLLLTSLPSGELFSEEISSNYLAELASSPSLKAEAGYTVNFNNVSIIEYMRFVSKIFGVNFVFKQEDLQFNVSIISEDPVSAKNVMSALVQILRIHDLHILEQENNLLITQNTAVNQIPTIVSKELPESDKAKRAILTRVFRIKNANLSTLITILRPMMSQDALIESSLETRQLIVTDITTNIDKIAQLLTSLDAPLSPLDFESYSAKYVPLGQLITLTQQIVTPFAENNPHIMVPQVDTNTIFIVSTPYLIDKSLAVLKDLDLPSEDAISQAATENIFVYKPQHKDIIKLQQALIQIANTLKEQHNPPTKLITSLLSAKVIAPSRSLLFIGDSETMTKVREILANIDTPFSELKATFFIYNIQHAQREHIEKALQQTADKLSHSEEPSKELIAAIHSMHWIQESNSLAFTGDEGSLQQIKNLLTLFDIPRAEETPVTPLPTEFYIYTPKARTGPEIVQAMHEIEKNLKESSLADPALLQTLSTIRWVPSSHSLIFTGDAKSLNEAKALLATIDGAHLIEKPETTFHLYKLQHASGDKIIHELEELKSDLASSKLPYKTDVTAAIDSIKWLKEGNSLLITGTKPSIEYIQIVVAQLDQAVPVIEVKPVETTFYIYKLQHVAGDKIIQELKGLKQDLVKSKLPYEADLITAIDTLNWLKESNSLLITGTKSSIEYIQAVVAQLDQVVPVIEVKPVETTFYIYKLQHVPGDKIIHELKGLKDDLAKSKLPYEADLMTAIDTINWLKESNSLLITGTKSSIEYIQAVVAQLDQAVPVIEVKQAETTFYVYKLQHVPGDKIIQELKGLSDDLASSHLPFEADLKSSINNIKWLKESNSLLITGTKPSIEYIQTVAAQLDQVVPVIEVKPAETTFYVYKLQHVPGNKIIQELRDLNSDISKSKLPYQADINTAINSLKWLKESNSLLITGTKPSIEYIQTLIAQLDQRIPLDETEILERKNKLLQSNTTFTIYKPQYQSGPDLIHILQDFTKNLFQCGVSDPDLFDAVNHLKWIERTNSLLIPGSPGSIAKIQELLQKFDVAGTAIGNTTIGSLENTNFLVYKLQYHKGAEITAALKQIATDLASAGPTTNQALLNAVNSLQWINVTNSLIASGNQETLTKLRTLIENLDIPLRQVFIEVLVIQTTLNNSQNFGLQWGGKAQYLDRFALGGNNMPVGQGSLNPNNFLPGLGGVNGTVFPDASVMIPPGVGGSLPFTAPTLPGFDLGVIGDIILHKGKSFISLGSLLNALQIDGDTTVVMNPKIITQDNNNSTIFVGQNIPFSSAVVQNQTSGTSGSLTTVNIEYRDVGVNLSITPILGNNDVVTLQIMNDITQQTSNTLQLSTVGSANITGLQTTHTNMSTRVTVPDQHFLVLSGMIQDSNNHFKSSIPCLGGLPLVGAAFGTNNRSRNKNNIIIFVRPQIINSFADYSKITDHQENLYTESAFLPAVQEAFEAGIDLVKTPEDEYR